MPKPGRFWRFLRRFSVWAALAGWASVAGDVPVRELIVTNDLVLEKDAELPARLIVRAAGEVHARDSTCVLIETGSDDSYWFRNNITRGGAQWQRTTTGLVTLDRIDAISLSLDSWGGDPFTVWLDGLTIE